MVRRKIDNRIRVLIENGVTVGHRTMFVVIGDKARDQVSVLIEITCKMIKREKCISEYFATEYFFYERCCTEIDTDRLLFFEVLKFIIIGNVSCVISLAKKYAFIKIQFYRVIFYP